MGYWGTKLFENDIAEDMKSSFLDLLKTKKTAEEIKKNIISEYYNDTDTYERRVLWIVLAKLFWDYGYLDEEINSNAHQAIEEGGDLDLWKEDLVQYQKRKEIFKSISEQLKTHNNNPKKIKKPKMILCPLKEGEIVAYKINEIVDEFLEYKDSYLLFEVINICRITYTESNGRLVNEEMPKIKVYNYTSKVLPTINLINELNTVYFKRPNETINYFSLSFSNKEWKNTQYVIIGSNSCNLLIDKTQTLHSGNFATFMIAYMNKMKK